MKHFLLITLLFCSFSLLSQTTIPAEKSKIGYCEAALFKDKVSAFTVSINFDEKMSVRLKNAEMEDRVFVSLPEFIEWMDGQGWNFFQFNPYIDPLEREIKLFQKILFKRK